MTLVSHRLQLSLRASLALAALVLMLMLAAACATPAEPHATQSPITPQRDWPTLTPFLPGPSATPTFTPQPATPTPQPSLYVAAYIPSSLRAALKLPQGWLLSEDPATATARLAVETQSPNGRWLYALVAPFPTLLDGVSAAELRDAWGGQPPAAMPVPLLMDESTYGVLSAWWGPPSPQAVEIVTSEQLLQTAWEKRPAWAIVPFDALEPRWKVLTIDGQSPIHKDFEAESYALSVPFSVPPALALPTTNRDPARLTTLVMTGVTALVRATAWTMELEGLLYPAEDIGGWLREADITHISNEVPFDPDCPYPNPGQQELVFCSDPKYIALLDDVGTDVVELTGDHFIDTGPEATLFTLDLYHQRGWLTYGGGATLEEALRPATLTHNGNAIAFVGCNAKGGGYATASASYPGAAACGYDALRETIADLTRQGYLVIVTFQHKEYYSYQVLPEYRLDFTAMADAGAIIVQGSQAHQPQNLEFYNGAFIHYGLGNLFFDQLKEVGGDQQPLDRAFIDRHVFYAGRYISTELLTIKFVDFARSRPMTLEERQAFLTVIFKTSGWGR